MTQEEKSLLLKDLCARLPYRPIVEIEEGLTIDLWSIDEKEINRCFSFRDYPTPKPYLKPMSSMTDEEKAYYFAINENPVTCIDWLNSHHFDYRGLIEKGLALKAPKEMYI